MLDINMITWNCSVVSRSICAQVICLNILIYYARSEIQSLTQALYVVSDISRGEEQQPTHNQN